MADIDEKPQTWMEATRALRKAMAEGKSDDIFGADPLAAKKQRPLDYLGGFANDEEAAKGGNADMSSRKPRKFHEGAIAKQGYRVIPGNAASGYTERKVRATVNALDSKLGGTVARGPISAPAGHALRHRDLMARSKAGPGVGPIARAPKPLRPKRS